MAQSLTYCVLGLWLLITKMDSFVYVDLNEGIHQFSKTIISLNLFSIIIVRLQQKQWFNFVNLTVDLFFLFCCRMSMTLSRLKKFIKMQCHRWMMVMMIIKYVEHEPSPFGGSLKQRWWSVCIFPPFTNMKLYPIRWQRVALTVLLGRWNLSINNNM